MADPVWIVYNHIPLRLHQLGTEVKAIQNVAEMLENKGCANPLSSDSQACLDALNKLTVNFDIIDE